MNTVDGTIIEISRPMSKMVRVSNTTKTYSYICFKGIKVQSPRSRQSKAVTVGFMQGVQKVVRDV